jgi:hypothetical protein
LYKEAISNRALSGGQILRKATLDLEEKADFSCFFQSQFQNANYVRPNFETGSTVTAILVKSVYFEYTTC